MKELEGDLIQFGKQGVFDVIIHGCNCFCTMGAGIAKGIKANFPEAYQADLQTEKGDKSKLGTFSIAEVKTEYGNLIVVNAYTQYNYKGKGRKVDYEALRNVFEKIKQQFTGKRIGYPAIGAGLAGGDWAVISEIIGDALEGEHRTFVEFEG